MKIRSAILLSSITITLGAIALVLYLYDGRASSATETADKSASTNGSISSPLFSQFSTTPDHSSSPQGDSLLKSYLSAKVRGSLARQVLDELYAASNFSKTQDNFEALRQSLKTSGSSEERVGLARLLSTFYSPNDANGLNKAVRAALLDAKTSNDMSYLSASVLAYVRLDYFDDSESFLAHARERRAIDDDAYYGELAHLLNLAPPGGRASILQNLQQGDNRYAGDILASQLKQGGAVAELPSPEARVLEKMLADREPVMPGEKNQIGLISTFQYSDWLKSVATLRAAGDPAKYDRAILERIGAPESDPRKAIAFLSNSESDSFILSQHRTPAYAQLLARIDTYAREPSSSPTVQELVRTVHHRTAVLSR